VTDSRARRLQYHKDYNRKNREARLLRNARHRAHQRGMPFDLEIDDIEIPELCPVFGIPMHSPSLDRVDNSKGYTKDNTEVISMRANECKRDMTPMEIAKLAVYYAREEVLALINV
jgi:hypothetical protein